MRKKEYEVWTVQEGKGKYRMSFFGIATLRAARKIVSSFWQPSRIVRVTRKVVSNERKT